MIKPEPSSRHPLVLFLLLLCVVSGTGILARQSPAPGSIESQMSNWTVIAWAAMLLVGATATLVGMALQPKRLRDGVLLEWVGMAALGPAALIYGGAILFQVGSGGFLSGGIIIGLGAACGWRFRTIWKTINKSKALMARAAGEGLGGDAGSGNTAHLGHWSWPWRGSQRHGQSSHRAAVTTRKR